MAVTFKDKEKLAKLKTLGNMADANQAALFDARRRAGSSSQMLDSIIQGSNCELHGQRQDPKSTALIAS